jgi:hypothetical protein
MRTEPTSRSRKPTQPRLPSTTRQASADRWMSTADGFPSGSPRSAAVRHRCLETPGCSPRGSIVHAWCGHLPGTFVSFRVFRPKYVRDRRAGGVPAPVGGSASVVAYGLMTASKPWYGRWPSAASAVGETGRVIGVVSEADHLHHEPFMPGRGRASTLLREPPYRSGKGRRRGRRSHELARRDRVGGRFGRPGGAAHG